MRDFLFASASDNLLSGLGSLSSSSENASFPVSDLPSIETQDIFAFADAAADDWIQKDVNLVTDPDAQMTGWTVDGDDRFINIVVPAAALFEIRVSGPEGTLSILNLYSGHSLKNDGTWQEAPTVLFSGDGDLQFQVESVQDCNGWTEVPLRITMTSTAIEVLLIPAVNLVALFGHNLGPVVPKLQSSEDDASWTDRATLEVDRPAFYGHLDEAIYARYWQVPFIGTNFEPIYLSYAWLGYATPALRPPRWGGKEEESWPQVRHTSDAGMIRSTAIVADQMRALTLDFTTDDSDDVDDQRRQLEQLRRDLWGRSRGGTVPVIIVPDAERPAVVLGMLAEKLGVTDSLDVYQETSLTVDPLPMAIVAP